MKNTKATTILSFALVVLDPVHLSPLNPKLTPGEIRSTSTKDACDAADQKSRIVTEAMKKQVCEMYGKKDECPKGYEIDHAIEVSLGGASTTKNLWPQPMKEARISDKFENRLHYLVCHGKLEIGAAQAALYEMKRSGFYHLPETK